MRKSRLTNEQLDLMAKSHRHNASDEQAQTWPENSEHYRETQGGLAEVLEELLDLPVYADFEPSMFLLGLACGVVFAAIVWLLFAHVSISWR